VIHRLAWWQLCLPLIVGASLLTPKRIARRALAGVVPALLGAAAFQVAPRGTGSYNAATHGLLLLGIMLPMLQAARALTGPRPDAVDSLPGAVLVAVGAVAIAARLLSQESEFSLAAAWATAALGLWWVLLLLGRAAGVRERAGWLDRVVLSRQPPQTLGSIPRLRRGAAAALAGGAALVLLAPHLALVVAGMMVASVGAELGFRSGRRIPVLPLVTLTLLPAYWLLDTVAGPEGLALANLPALPLSPAAARLVAIPLAMVAWAWMGLWPLHGVVRPVLLAPLGAALWMRVAVPLTAEGLAHWQPLSLGVAAAGLWHAAADGRLASVFVALAFLALASLGPVSVPAAALLLAAAAAFKLPRPRGGPGAAGFELVRRLGFATSAAGAGLAFAAGLRAEVVLTVVAAGGLAYGYVRASALNDQ
jgi:hypothetical protein